MICHYSLSFCHFFFLIVVVVVLMLWLKMNTSNSQHQICNTYYKFIILKLMPSLTKSSTFNLQAPPFSFKLLFSSFDFKFSTFCILPSSSRLLQALCFLRSSFRFLQAHYFLPSTLLRTLLIPFIFYFFRPKCLERKLLHG